MLAGVPENRPRVLVLSASIGGGHVAAGRALHKAFTALDTEVEHIDLLEHTAVPFRRLYRQAYFDLVRNVPDLVEWVGRRMDRRPSERKTSPQRLRARVTRLLSYELPRTIDKYRPHAVVHTHFLGAEIVAGRLRRRQPLPQAEVITDFFAHNLWLQPGIARYFVASEELRVHMLAAGVDPNRVRVTGIPIDPAFASLPSRAEARAKFGLSSDREVLLLLAGGLEAAGIRNVLEQLRDFRWPLSVIVVCGRSPELQRVAHSATEGAEGPVTFSVMGFVDDMPTLMAAADIAVTKPGGLTTSEALASSLPLVLISPYPLQEEANARVLLEQGCAVQVEPLTTFAHKLRKLLEEPDRLASMRQAAAPLAHPDAAGRVARTVLDELVPSVRSSPPVGLAGAGR